MNLIKVIALMDNETLIWFTEAIEGMLDPDIYSEIIEDGSSLGDHIDEVAEARGGWEEVHGWSVEEGAGGSSKSEAT